MNMENQLNEESLNTEKKDINDNSNEVLTDSNDGLENVSDKIEEPTTEDLLNAANEKIVELNDKYLRQVAEFDNYRKRVIKELYLPADLTACMRRTRLRMIRRL